MLLIFFVWILTVLNLCENFVFFQWNPFFEHAIDLCLSEGCIYEYILVAVLFLLLIQLYIKLWIMTYCLRYAFIITYIHTFNVVTFDTGTNFPAVRWNSLLAVAMMNIRHRWNGIAVPTQSHPNAASLTLCACNIFTINVLRFCVACSLGLNVPAGWHTSCYVRCKWSSRFPQVSNFLA